MSRPKDTRARGEEAAAAGVTPDTTCEVVLACPRCGLPSPGIRCPRCDAVKLAACSGECASCRKSCGG